MLGQIVLIVKHKQTIVQSVLQQDRPSLPITAHILYHPIENATLSVQQSKLGSFCTSSTTSKSSINQASTKITVLQLESLAGPNSISKQDSHTQSVTSARALFQPVAPSSTLCSVQCGTQWLQYGFEYWGSGRRSILLTPTTERCMVHIVQAFTNYQGGIINKGIARTETAEEITKVHNMCRKTQSPYYHAILH